MDNRDGPRDQPRCSEYGRGDFVCHESRLGPGCSERCLGVAGQLRRAAHRHSRPRDRDPLAAPSRHCRHDNGHGTLRFGHRLCCAAGGCHASSAQVTAGRIALPGHSGDRLSISRSDDGSGRGGQLSRRFASGASWPAIRRQYRGGRWSACDSHCRAEACACASLRWRYDRSGGRARCRKCGTSPDHCACQVSSISTAVAPGSAGHRAVAERAAAAHRCRRS